MKKTLTIFLIGLMLNIPMPTHAQTQGYIPSYLPLWTCDSMKISGRWSWHDSSQVPAGFQSEFSFLAASYTPEKPYTRFLFERTAGGGGPTSSSTMWIRHRDYQTTRTNSAVFSQYISIAEPNANWENPGMYEETDTPVYVALTRVKADYNNMDFYACYLTSAAATATPTSNPPTNTPTPTATPESVTFFGCTDESPVFIDGYNYYLDVPAGLDNFRFSVNVWGNAKIKVTTPGGGSTTHDFFSAFPRIATVDYATPATGRWYFEFTGSPATYGNDPTAEFCITTSATVTPTPGTQTPTANPTGTPTPTATLEPTKQGPPTMPASTPTPATWPTASIPTPAPVPTMPGCTAPNYFCGQYFAPVEGTVAEFELEYEKTYCYTLIPEIGIVNFPGFTLCLDTYSFNVSIFDMVIPVVIIFTIMAIIIIYKIIQS